MSNLAQPKTRQKSLNGDPDTDPKAPNVVRIRVDEADPLASFKPEGPTKPAASQPASNFVTAKGLFAASAMVVVAALLAVAGGWFFLNDRSSAQRTTVTVPPLLGHATLNSRPDGAAVIIDGVARGITPLELDLSAGVHDVLFRSDTGERRIALTVESRTRASENIDMPTVSPVLGQITVTSEPSDARVSLDGKPAGQTPLELKSVAAGRHVIGVSQGTTVVNRTVELARGAAVNLFVSLAAPGNGPTGSFAVDSPLELRLLEDGQLLGLSDAAPLIVSAGKHQFELVNDSLEMRLTRTVTVDSGKTTRVSVPLPNGTLFVNASPWAEVFVDGRSIGVTPLGSVAVPVGSREIVWRHPQLGERRRTVVVGAQTPVRLAMDMSR